MFLCFGLDDAQNLFFPLRVRLVPPELRERPVPRERL